MAFTITIQSSGNSFTCEPTQNILAAGLDAGLMLPYNCRSGLCRTCKSRIVSGEIAYAGQLMTHYLTAADQAAGAALLCQANPRSDLLIDAAEIVGVENVQPGRMPCRIIAMDRLAPDVMRLKLRLPLNEHVRYFPGQHLAIELNDGQQREYSIANPCDPEGMADLEIHVRHLPGGLFTDPLFSEIALRSLLRIEVPLGTFFLRAGSANPLTLIATGTGFAPIKAMVEHAIVTGIADDRAIHFYWGGRQWQDLYLAELVEEWAAAHPRFRFVPVLSRDEPVARRTARTGYVQDRVLDDHPDLSAFDVYACGSPRMVEDARTRFAALGAAAPAAFYADEFITAAERATRAGDILEQGMTV